MYNVQTGPTSFCRFSAEIVLFPNETLSPLHCFSLQGWAQTLVKSSLVRRAGNSIGSAPLSVKKGRGVKEHAKYEFVLVAHDLSCDGTEAIITIFAVPGSSSRSPLEIIRIIGTIPIVCPLLVQQKYR